MISHPNAQIKDILDTNYSLRNDMAELSKPDPLSVAKDYQTHKYCDEISLFCALLSYGNAKQIVKTLKQINFQILESTDLKSAFFSPKKFDEVFVDLPIYRFQTRRDLAAFMVILQEIIQNGGIKQIFLSGYNKPYNNLPKVIHGINSVIDYFNHNSLNFTSRGLEFMLGKISQTPKASSPLKRWNMFLRWMVRKDNLDMGLWSEIAKSDLLLPLDTHTFKICHKIGLIQSKAYNLHSAIEATNTLKLYDEQDPIKYDFALYRIGQENIFSAIFDSTPWRD